MRQLGAVLIGWISLTAAGAWIYFSIVGVPTLAEMLSSINGMF